MFSWDHRLVAPWECGFASHDHAVVFQILDSEETPMAMRVRIRWCRYKKNSGRLDMADAAEAGTDVSSRTWVEILQMGMWLPKCRQNWRRESSRGCSQRGYRSRRNKLCCLWCCEWWQIHRDVRTHCKWWWRTGGHWTWAFSIRHITWFGKFLLDSDAKSEMQLILNTRRGWNDFNLGAKLPS